MPLAPLAFTGVLSQLRFASCLLLPGPHVLLSFCAPGSFLSLFPFPPPCHLHGHLGFVLGPFLTSGVGALGRCCGIALVPPQPCPLGGSPAPTVCELCERKWQFGSGIVKLDSIPGSLHLLLRWKSAYRVLLPGRCGHRWAGRPDLFFPPSLCPLRH